MKIIICICVLIAGISSLPENHKLNLEVIKEENLQPSLADGIRQENSPIITAILKKLVRDLSNIIKDEGLDPYEIKRAGYGYSLPVPVLLSIEAFVEDLLLVGLSDIVVHSVDYNIITKRLTFDIRIPRIQLSIGKAVSDVTILGSNSKLSVSGSLAVVGIRLRGNIRFNVGIVTGIISGDISIRDIDINFDVNEIDSKLRVVANGEDVSRQINWYLGKRVPAVLNEYSEEIDELLTIVIRDIIEANL